MKAPRGAGRIRASSRAGRAALVMALASAAQACAPGGGTQGAQRAAVTPAAVEGAATATAPRPRFGFGAPADEARIAAWDRDVGPDGVGLPPGRGSVAEGGVVFLTRCVACHGVTGTEGPNDVLVGGEPWGDGEAPRRRTIGNYWPYATTLFDYITRAMPQNDPGALSADETYAVIAWLLARNGIVSDDAVLDAASLAAVVMPAGGRFGPDDRRGGPEIR